MVVLYLYIPIYFQHLAGHSSDLSKQERFTLRSEMLPSYLPSRVAEKILFVGESVQIFESERSKSQQRHKGFIATFYKKNSQIQ